VGAWPEAGPEVIRKAREGHGERLQLRDPARDTEASIERGDTWVLTFASHTVATMTMTILADKDP